MHEFWMRYRRREWTEKDRETIGWFVYAPYLISSFFLMAIIDIEITDRAEEALALAIPIFFFPWLAIILLVQKHIPPQFPSIRRKIALFVVAVIYSVAAAGTGFGYINFANALTGNSTPVMVQGPVVNMEIYSGRWIGTRRMVTIRFENREVNLSQTAEEYSRTKVGDTYGREMKLGGLGYYYRWGLAFWK